MEYDVIVVSPSWAVELASAALLTDEFFRRAFYATHRARVDFEEINQQLIPR